jgi:hypothetical protein
MRAHWEVVLADATGEESARFHVEASTALIACTRAATRLFGPEAEQRRVFACAACGQDLWDGGRTDSSGFRLCADCDPSDIEDREEQEPIGLVVGTSRLRANILPPLPGDEPLGGVTVIVPDPRSRLEAGENLDQGDALRILARELRGADMSEEIIGDLVIRDETGAYFSYETRIVAAPVDAQVLIDRGLVDPESGAARGVAVEDEEIDEDEIDEDDGSSDDD